MEEIIKEKGDMLAVYEVSYLLLPSLAVEQVPGKASSLKEVVTSLGGTVISDENPVLIDLAYPMVKVVGTDRHKANQGYFGWVKFEMTTGDVEKVKKALDADVNTLRYLIIKTVRENTLLEGKMRLQKEEKFVREDDELEEVPVEALKEVAPEELDKNIDEIVAE
jgi:ribosomal protein S6